MTVDLSKLIPATDVVELTMGEYRTKANATMIKAVEDVAMMITGPVPSVEQLSWTTKEEAATAYLAGTATQAQTQMLQLESDETGESLTLLSTKILQQGPLYRAVIAPLTGIRRNVRDAIDACMTKPQVDEQLGYGLARIQAFVQSLTP